MSRWTHLPELAAAIELWMRKRTDTAAWARTLTDDAYADWQRWLVGTTLIDKRQRQALATIDRPMFTWHLSKVPRLTTYKSNGRTAIKGLLLLVRASE